MGQKNIVLFMVDQLSAKWLELAMENDICPLPNIKALRESGTYFNHAITSNPVCCPTRATIATGLTTRGHGLLENGYRLDENIPTFMKCLQRAGYRTGVLGKLHLEPHYKGFYPDYHKYGFDVTHITEDGRGGEWLDWVKETYPDYYNDILAEIWTPFIPEFSCYGLEQENLAMRIKETRDNYHWATERFPRNEKGAHTQQYPKEITQTEWITGHALKFLEESSGHQPFFMQVSYVQPHIPFTVPAEYLAMVNPLKIPKPVEPEWLKDFNMPEHFKRQKRPGQRDHEYFRMCYFADLVHLDGQLGRVINKAQQLGQYQDTYFIFTSDHGDLLGDHGFYGKGEHHYDACIRVPLIISGPNLQKGAICSGFVQHEDICPTILAMADLQFDEPPHITCNLTISKEKSRMFHGQSMLEVCAGQGAVIRKVTYTESYNNIFCMEYTDWSRTIRTSQYRYTYYAGNNGEQLFDLEHDPDEQANLFNDIAYQKIKQELKDLLLEQIIYQDWPKTPRSLFAFGAH